MTSQSVSHSLGISRSVQYPMKILGSTLLSRLSFEYATILSPPTYFVLAPLYLLLNYKKYYFYILNYII